MRCPKCQYISFDSGDRCRNCGYEFSLAAEDPPLDVIIKRDELPGGRLKDTAFAAMDTPISASQTPEPSTGTFGRRPLTAEDLPLFTERFADDQAPLVTPPAVPRAPLSVRRANPVGPRGRARPHLPEELSLDLAADAGEGRDVAPPLAGEPVAAGTASAGVVRRVSAGVIDATLLSAIHATVVYLTLRLSELRPEEWQILPLVPLVAFLLLLSGGYFVLFTAAGGQTIGKMTTGIRVINAADDADAPLRVAFGTAVMRTIACLGSVVAVGAGFLPILFSADRRAFHDRIAGTRVVRA
jgi:uncharacterized RDD family membrane protein YckC